MALNSACKSCGTRPGPEDNDGANTQPELCARCRAREAAKNHPLAVQGRQLKALAMAAVIDANAIRQGLSPFDQAGRVLLASQGWSDSVWEDIGENAVKPDGTHYERKAISPETRDLVKAIYRGRATAPVESRRAS